MALRLPKVSSVCFQTAHSEITALTVPSNAIAVRAHATVLRGHVEIGNVKTDGKETRVMKVSFQMILIKHTRTNQTNISNIQIRYVASAYHALKYM